MAQWFARKRRLQAYCHPWPRGQEPSPYRVGKLTHAPQMTHSPLVTHPVNLNFHKDGERNRKKLYVPKIKQNGNARKSRVKKQEKSRKQSPVQTASTPMNNSHNDTLITNESILLMDRNLREMLASEDERSRDNGDNERYVMSSQQ